MTGYPIPTPERRAIVRELSAAARALDFEAGYHDSNGAWDSIVSTEIRRAAGITRFTATLIIQGAMSTRLARIARASTRAYLALVRRADREGVIR